MFCNSSEWSQEPFIGKLTAQDLHGGSLPTMEAGEVATAGPAEHKENGHHCHSPTEARWVLLATERNHLEKRRAVPSREHKESGNLEDLQAVKFFRQRREIHTVSEIIQ